MQPGDEIIVGQYRIEFHLGVPKPTTPKPDVSTAKHSPPPTKPPKPAPPKSKKEIPAVPVEPPGSLSFKNVTAVPEDQLAEVKGTPYVRPKNMIGTFAPESEIKDLNKVIKPATGNV